VNDRLRWKEALAEGHYDPQCVTLAWGDHTRPATDITNCTGLGNNFCSIVTPVVDNDTNNNNIKHLGVVNNLAKVLLQIEQSVDRRFLRQPLGDSQKTPEKKRGGAAKSSTADESSSTPATAADNNKPSCTVLQNWERSLMYCTSLSQLFVHLQSLDESIAWSKSVKNAKCRLCNRKGDAEKMLLCDSCDRGHHIYCLRPPLCAIPAGEWFCPKCRPKTVEKTPRKMRKSFVAGDDLYSEDETEPNAKTGRKQQKTANRSAKYESLDEEEEDEDEADETDSDEVEYAKKPTASKGRAKQQTSGKSAATTNGHHVINGHVTEEDEDEEPENRSRGGGNGKKRKLAEEVVIKQATKAVTKKEQQPRVGSSSLTSMTSTTSAASSTSNSYSAFAASTGRRATRQAAQHVDYQEAASSDHQLSGTDDDSVAGGGGGSRKKQRGGGVAPGNTVKLSPSAASSNDTSSRNAETTARMKAVESLITELMKHEDCWHFLKPVPKREVKIEIS
jgi:bromodomain adjacent to zinc finger domain protein 1A